ncbi:MAG: hypothetical protein Q7S36_00870 [Candidatus Liptonbacteria bacterium]|nr:hypothetical protein [Candidatus Liptonbacteria bacterium]
MRESLPSQNNKEPKSRKKIELSSADKEAVAELEQPIKEILAQLSHEINCGDYGVIIGDDASGRIPTLMIARIIKAVYENKNFSPPIVRFIAGSSSLNANYVEQKENKKEAVVGQMGRIKSDLRDVADGGHRGLIVTDTIDLGSSVTVLIEALQKNDMEADVATIGMIDSEGKERFADDWKANVAIGTHGTPSLYFSENKRSLSGVWKINKNLFAKPNAKLPENYAKLSPNRQQHSVKYIKRSQALTNKAREFAFEIADRIAEEYIKNPED